MWLIWWLLYGLLGLVGLVILYLLVISIVLWYYRAFPQMCPNCNRKGLRYVTFHEKPADGQSELGFVPHATYRCEECQANYKLEQGEWFSINDAGDQPATHKPCQTPQELLDSLADAYRRKDLELAVARQDFTTLARLMLTSLNKDVVDDELIEKTEEVLDLGYRAEKKKDGFPNWQGLTSTILDQTQRPDGLLIVTQAVRDGSASSKLTKCCYRILNEAGDSCNRSTNREKESKIRRSNREHSARLRKPEATPRSSPFHPAGVKVVMLSVTWVLSRHQVVESMFNEGAVSQTCGWPILVDQHLCGLRGVFRDGI